MASGFITSWQIDGKIVKTVRAFTFLCSKITADGHCSLQSFPASGSFPMSQLFESGGQSIEATALASVFPMNIQD